MFSFDENNVIVTTDMLATIVFTESVMGYTTIVMRFTGKKEDFFKAGWPNWTENVRKNSVDAPEFGRINVDDNSIAFPTGAFKNVMKAQIGGMRNSLTNTETLTIRMFFTNKAEFKQVKEDIEGCLFFQDMVVFSTTNNVLTKQAAYKKP